MWPDLTNSFSLTDNNWHRVPLQPFKGGNLQQEEIANNSGLTLKNEYYHNNYAWLLTVGLSCWANHSTYLAFRLTSDDGTYVTSPMNTKILDDTSASEFTIGFTRTFKIIPQVNYSIPEGTRVYLEICHPGRGSYYGDTISLTNLSLHTCFTFEVISLE